MRLGYVGRCKTNDSMRLIEHICFNETTSQINTIEWFSLGGMWCGGKGYNYCPSCGEKLPDTDKDEKEFEQIWNHFVDQKT